MIRKGNCEDIEGGLSTAVSALEVDACERDVRRSSMIGVNASLPTASSDLRASCWASKTAGGVRTPECEKIVGTVLEYRRDNGVPPGAPENMDDVRRTGLVGAWGVEGRRGELLGVLLRWDVNRAEDRFCNECRREFDATLPDIRPVRVGVDGRPSTSGTSLSESRGSTSDSESDSNGSSLSAFIAAATHKSAIFVTAFSFAINSLWAKLRSPVSMKDCGPSGLDPLLLRIELALLPRLVAILANRRL